MIINFRWDTMMFLLYIKWNLAKSELQCFNSSVEWFKFQYLNLIGFTSKLPCGEFDFHLLFITISIIFKSFWLVEENRNVSMEETSIKINSSCCLSLFFYVSKLDPVRKSMDGFSWYQNSKSLTVLSRFVLSTKTRSHCLGYKLRLLQVASWNLWFRPM